MQTDSSRLSTHARRRAGAALVEAILVVAVITLMLGLLASVHRAGAARIQAFQKARAEGWATAMAGCPGTSFGLRELVTGLAHGELPLPDAFLPTHHVSVSYSPSGGSSINVRIPCASAPPTAEGDAGDWIYDLFGR
jgi:hypothetical protein